MQLHFALLDKTVEFQEFDCGDERLNSFLRNLALPFQIRRFGVTIICSNTAGKIIGYYTLCPASILREELPKKMLTGPRPNPLPGFRLCRLAIDQQYQGKGYGKILFVHALKKCVDQAKQIGGSVIIIDAKHEQAKKFYEYFGFISLSENSMTLFQTVKYIECHWEDL